MASLGIICLALFAVLCAIAYILYMKKKSIEAYRKIEHLKLQQDTADIIYRHKIEEVDKSWEEYDKQQWLKRFEEDK